MSPKRWNRQDTFTGYIHTHMYICIFIRITYTPEMKTDLRVTSLATRISNKCFVRSNQSVPAFPL